MDKLTPLSFKNPEDITTRCVVVVEGEKHLLRNFIVVGFLDEEHLDDALDTLVVTSTNLKGICKAKAYVEQIYQRATDAVGKDVMKLVEEELLLDEINEILGQEDDDENI